MRIPPAVLCALLVARGAGAAETVVIGLSQDPAVVSQLDAGWPTPALSRVETLSCLSGIAAPDESVGATMKAKLDEAERLEAEFQTNAAIALLDEVIRTYERHPLFDGDLQLSAARALHNRAAALLADGNEKDALASLVEAQRRFPGVALDTQRHPPQMAQLFHRAYGKLQAMPRVRVTVRTTKAGIVRLDGRSLGRAEEVLAVEVPAGAHMLWISDATQTSLMHPVTITPGAILAVDFGLESQLQWAPRLTMKCAPTCEAALRSIATACGLTNAIGLRAPSNKVEALIVAQNGDSRIEPVVVPGVAASADRATSIEAGRGISPLSFAPLGIGQFTQSRPVAGTIVAGLSAAAIAWNVITASDRDRSAADDSRTQQNISAGTLAAVVIGGIVEAVIHDATSDTP